MNEFLLALLQAVLIAAVPVCTAYAVKGLSALARYFIGRTENETAKKYMADVTDIISTAVSCTSQTYVDALKKNDIFDKAAQLEALEKSKEKTLSLLSASTKSILAEIYGDLDAYLETKIEAEVRAQK